MIRGEVWEVAQTVDEWPRKVAILSGEAWNGVAKTQCVAVVRGHGVPEMLPFHVALGDTDPASGMLAMTTLGPIHPSALLRCVGSLTGATLEKVSVALKDIYELG